MTKALDVETETKSEAAGFETESKTEAGAPKTEAKTEAVYLETEAEAQGSCPMLLTVCLYSLSITTSNSMGITLSVN